MRALISLILGTLGLACTAPEEPLPIAARAPLVYGEDDRQEVSRAADDPALYESARAVAAVIPRSRVRHAADGTPQIDADSLQDTEGLCADEPYAGQPSAAECTAALIDDNLLATAGHCFRHAWDCENYLFVFDYFHASEAEDGKPELGPLSIHECRRALIHESDARDGSPVRDYAIVELTERVAGRTPLPLRGAPLQPDDPLVVISSTGGVPLKIDLGSRVLDPRTDALDYFALDSDTFHGSSGAPVLDADGALIGLLARGKADYVFDETAQCYRVARRPSPEARREPEAAGAAAAAPLQADAGSAFEPDAEQASYVPPAIAALCQTRYPSLRLCGIAPARPVRGGVEPDAARGEDDHPARGCSAAEQHGGSLAWIWLPALFFRTGFFLRRRAAAATKRVAS